jgi:hypothetical protein
MKHILIFIFYFLSISLVSALQGQRVIISDSLKITNIPSSRANYPLLAIANDTIFRRGYNDLKLVRGFGVLSDTSINSILISEGFTDQIGLKLPIYKFDTLLAGDWQEINNFPNNPSPRSGHVATFINGKMIIWGGTGGSNGGIFDIQSQTWQTISSINAPTQIYGDDLFALSLTNNVIIWTGEAINSKVLNPSNNQWSNISTINSFIGTEGYSVVSTGSELLFFSQNSSGPFGKKYNLNNDQWSNISQTNMPLGAYYHTAIWTGTEMIVWGGMNISYNYQNSGSKYNPQTDTWTPISSINAPGNRAYHSSIWSGNEMIVWGGLSLGGGMVNSGGKYDPISNIWKPMSNLNNPIPRSKPIMSWTNYGMVIWGCKFGYSPSECQTGALYDPSNDVWKSIANFDSPSSREMSTGVWTGDQFLIYGGSSTLNNTDSNQLFALNPNSAGFSFDANKLYYLYQKQ